MRVTPISITTAIVVILAGSALAQDRRALSPDEQSKYVVSARAGVVSIVAGNALVTREKTPLPAPLRAGDELQFNDTVKTDANTRIEILLNPGSYLRLGENSELVFQFDEVDKNQIKLSSGSAVIEASAVDDMIIVETPKTTFEIIRDGIYRFNIDGDGRGEVAVRKGRILVGKTTIRAGRRATVEGETAVVSKLNAKEADSLDDWSKDRAKTLIASNRQLSDSLMRRSLSLSFLANAWVFDPFCRCYTFLPYSGGFSSPYGWSYSVCNPYWYYSPRNNGGSNGGGGYYGGNPGSGSGGGGSSGGGGRTGGGTSGGGHASPPPPPPSAQPSPGGRADREVMHPRRP